MRLVFVARLRQARGERERGRHLAASGDKYVLAEPAPYVLKIHPRYELNEVAGISDFQRASSVHQAAFA
jgi:hypothetical protein